jgi:hypothetical protein
MVSLLLPGQGSQGIGYALLILFVCLICLIVGCYINWDDYGPILKEKCPCTRKAKNSETDNENRENMI